MLLFKIIIINFVVNQVFPHWVEFWISLHPRIVSPQGEDSENKKRYLNIFKREGGAYGTNMSIVTPIY